MKWSPLIVMLSILPIIEPLESRTMLADAAPIGDGIKGEYFDSAQLTQLKAERVDGPINFKFGRGAPIGGVKKDTYSIRWSGYVLAPISGQFTFTTRSDDGVLLWVDDQLLVNDWNYHGATENSGRITLEGGRLYPIKLEYFQGTGNAEVRLDWTPPGWKQQVVPRANLFTKLPAAPTPPPTPEPEPEPDPIPLPGIAPIAAIAFAPGTANRILPDQSIHLYGTESIISGKLQNATIEWDCGDIGGSYNIGRGFNYAHVYDTPGQYTITLKVTDEVGRSDTDSTVITVLPDPRPVIYAANQAEFDAKRATFKDSMIFEFAPRTVFTVAGNPWNLPFLNVTLRTRGGNALEPEDYAIIRGVGLGGRNILGINQDHASGISVQQLAFNSDIPATGNVVAPNAINCGGTNITVRDVIASNVNYGVLLDANGAGRLVQNLNASVQGYPIWTRGAPCNTILGGYLESIASGVSVNGFHAIRGPVAWLNVSHCYLDARSTWFMHGQYLYFGSNTAISSIVTNPSVSFTPFATIDATNPATYRSRYGVFERNTFHCELLFGHGTEHVRATDNVSQINRSTAYKLIGYSAAAQRGVEDVTIANNTVIIDGDDGAGLWLLADAGEKLTAEAKSIRFISNLVVGKDVTTGMSGVIQTGDADLSSFDAIDNNVGIFPRLPYFSSVAKSFGQGQKIDEFNALPRVGENYIGPVPIDGELSVGTPQGVAGVRGN